MCVRACVCVRFGKSAYYETIIIIMFGLYNNNNNDKLNGSVGGIKCNYGVLMRLPKRTIFCFYCRTLLVTIYIIIKWCLQFIWTTISNTRVLSKRRESDDTRLIEYYGDLHDKPPPCLVDNRIGLQSYVKLKV